MKLGLIDHKRIGEYDFWLSHSGRIGTTLALTPIDLELARPQRVERSLQLALKHLPEELYLKWHLTNAVSSISQEDHARAAAIESIGQAQVSLLLHIEMKCNGFFKKLGRVASTSDFFDIACKKLQELLPIADLQRNGMNPKAVPAGIVKNIFPHPNKPLVSTGAALDTGTEVIGLLKLDSLGSYSMSYETLANIKDEIPSPFEIVVHQKMISKGITQKKLDITTKRESNITDATGYSKSVAAQEAKRGVELHGNRHFSFEFTVILKRQSSTELKNDLNEAMRALAGIGDCTIESIGAEPTYTSSLPGTPFHLSGMFDTPLEEETHKLPGFLPIFTRGNPFSKPNHSTAFAFHRLDFSVDFFSIFDRRYKNYCTNIIGDSGVGKSVVINRLITCANHSQKSKTIIVDVAGSHTRLVQRLNGAVHEINLDEPSGINPFSYLKADASEYTVSVVSTFLCDLIVLESEPRVPEEISADVTDLLLQYANTYPESPSIDDFISFAGKRMPREKLLKRFSSKGAHKHLFSTTSDVTANRIKYYNFSNIDTAAHRSAAKAIMSAILAEVNISLKSKRRDEEVIFLCDEAPFFLEACFHTFKFLSKNMRKLLGALLISVQVSGDLVVNGDKSLVDNAGSTLFLSWDDDPEAFSNRFKLHPEQMDLIQSLEGVKGQYSQFAIKDRFGIRVANLILEDREYWESTTEGLELERLTRLLEQFPEVPQETLITLLGEQRRFKKATEIIA